MAETDSIAARAAQWGIETEHYDGLGRHWVVAPSVLERILDLIATDTAPSTQVATAPTLAYQGDEALPRRSWALAVQLYSVRTRRNWGHGDFTDLACLIELAASLGASGVGLNPLHALFDDRAEEASPYFPNSRLFLNPLYIDVEAIAECPSATMVDLRAEIDALRSAELVDYAGVARVKMRALALAYDGFRRQGSADRHRAFDNFRDERGAVLAEFSAFELLRRWFGSPWQDWPLEWRKPEEQALRRLRATDAEQLEFFEFVQWIADRQLNACRDRAGELGLPLGLYLDLAVGVRADGFDAWRDQTFILPAIEIGAPPDLLNTQGQAWGLAGFNPVDLISRHCEPVREVLRASMRYAGAIRIDHVLGLKRLYLVPRGTRADHGAYIRFPFESLLQAAAEESVANRCVVIGEDLGNVPPGFRETLAQWGLWSYQVMMFERAEDKGFISPDHYRPNALVTFATHDLATFAGWRSGHDLAAKRALGLDPGETDDERAAAFEALGRAMTWRGLPTIDFLSVTKFIADTPCRLLMVSMEDALGMLEQVNLPGTVAEHPNWRRKLTVDLEDVMAHSALASVAGLMTASGRRTTDTARENVSPGARD